MTLGHLPLVVAPIIVIASVLSSNNPKNVEEKSVREFSPELAVREPFAVKFKIQSTWGSTLPLHIELERSELYAFSGHKDVSLPISCKDGFAKVNFSSPYDSFRAMRLRSNQSSWHSPRGELPSQKSTLNAHLPPLALRRNQRTECSVPTTK